MYIYLHFSIAKPGGAGKKDCGRRKLETGEDSKAVEVLNGNWN